MIDLHIHTTSSDGSDEPEVILAKAQKSGLRYISITDHDSIGSYKKLKKVKIDNYFSGKIITGCEFSVAHNGTPIEILAYDIDLKTIEETGIVSEEKFLERENQYLKTMMNICKNIGIKYDNNLSIAGGKYFATQVLYFNLKKYPENEKHFSTEVWKGVNGFYRTCVNNENSPFYINQLKNTPSVEEIAKVIKKAGGKSFLAHLYVYYSDDHEKFLNSITSLNAIDGIECYHSLHTMDNTDFLLDYCKIHKLYMSGGSDYHGKIKPKVILGESLPGVQIPYKVSEKWLPSCRLFSGD
ncbi:MAG TPA: PHP domain-containing protein [Clostridium sp.]|uniref:PHP domain-containing protein n=1 Tax=Clostridium sp. TaxID=1506 RepID=UPI002F947CBE